MMWPSQPAPRCLQGGNQAESGNVVSVLALFEKDPPQDHTSCSLTNLRLSSRHPLPDFSDTVMVGTRWWGPRGQRGCGEECGCQSAWQLLCCPLALGVLTPLQVSPAPPLPQTGADLNPPWRLLSWWGTNTGLFPSWARFPLCLPVLWSGPRRPPETPTHHLPAHRASRLSRHLQVAV